MLKGGGLARFHKLITLIRTLVYSSHSSKAGGEAVSDFALNSSTFVYIFFPSARKCRGINCDCRSTSKCSNCSPMRKEVY